MRHATHAEANAHLLDYAAEGNSVGVLISYLCGANLHTKNEQGEDALQIAIRHQHSETIDAILNILGQPVGVPGLTATVE